jgi:hypothetical protein
MTTYLKPLTIVESYRSPPGRGPSGLVVWSLPGKGCPSQLDGYSMEKDIEVSLHLREEGSCGPKSLCDKNSMLVLALDLTLDLVKPFRDFHWVHQLLDLLKLCEVTLFAAPHEKFETPSVLF